MIQFMLQDNVQAQNKMKKLLGIVVLGLLLSGNAYAGVNEPGSGPIPIASITELKSYYYKYLAKAKKKKQTFN